MSSFDRNFNIKHKSDKLPIGIINRINENLPSNSRYVYDETSKIYVCGFQLTINKNNIANYHEFEKESGKNNLSINDVLNYSINAQKIIRLIFSEDEKIKIGNNLTEFENMFLGKHKLKVQKDSFVMYPYKLNDSFKSHIIINNNNYEVVFNRKPNNSINEIKLESSDDFILKIVMYIDGNKGKCKVSINNAVIKSCQEYLAALKLLNDSMEYGLNIDGNIIKIKNKMVNRENEKFWNIVCEIEKETGILFDCKKNLSEKDARWILNYYFSAVKNKPVVISNVLTKIQASEKTTNIEELINSINDKNKKYVFMENGPLELEIIGGTINAYCIKCFYNLYIKGYIEDKKQLLVDKADDEAVTSMLIFENEEKYIEFCNKNNVIEYMSHAKTINEYIAEY